MPNHLSMSALFKGALAIVRQFLLAPKVGTAVSRQLKREYGIDLSIPRAIKLTAPRGLVASFRGYGPTSAAARLALDPLIVFLQRYGLNQETVLNLVYDNYIASVPPSLATALAEKRLVGVTKGSTGEVLGAISEVRNVLIDHQSTGLFDRSLFEFEVREFPKYFGHRAEGLLIRWPKLATVFIDLAHSDNRAQLLSTWLQADVKVLQDAPPEIHGLLGELAEAYGSATVAASYYKSARVAGASPSDYWRVREIQCRDNWSVDESLRFLAEGGQHPWLRAAVRQLENGDADGAEGEWLLNWQPSGLSEQTQKEIVQLRLGAGFDDDYAKITRGKALWQRTGLPEAGVITVKALLEMTRTEEGLLYRDQSEALELAIEVRDACRSFSLPAGNATACAMDAAIALDDPTLAMRLGQFGPEGDATELESNAQVVLSRLAIIYAQFGDDARVTELLPRIASGARSYEVKALAAEGRGHFSAAIVYWTSAISLETSMSTKAQMLWQLACLGIVHPAVKQISKYDVELANDIRLAADVSLGRLEGLAAARYESISNPRVAHTLLRYCKKKGSAGDHDAEKLALAVGERFEDPHLLLRAAEYALAAGRTTDARVRAQKATSLTTKPWGGRAKALRVLVNAAIQDTNWELAAREGRRLLWERPKNTDVIWSLTNALFRSGEVKQASTTYAKYGSPYPESRDQAMLWLVMQNHLGPEFGSMRTSFQFLKSWPDDEPLHAAFIYTYIRMELAEDEVELFGPVVTAYFDRYGDSGSIRRFEIDGDNPIESLNKAVAPASHVRELEQSIRAGNAPLGLATAIAGRTYTETLVLWGHAPRHDLDHGGQVARDALTAALADGLLIDLSALLSAACISDSLSKILLGAFPSVSLTTVQYQDVLQGEHNVSRMSDLSMSPRGPGGVYEPVSTSQEQIATVQRITRGMVALAKGVPKEVSISLGPFEKLGGDEGTNDSWLSSAGHAVVSSRVLWCDDVMLRRLAMEQGVRTFNTVDVLLYLREGDVFSGDQLDLCLAELLRAGYVSVPATLSAFRLALQIDGYKPLGVGQGFLYSGFDSEVEFTERVNEILDACSALEEDPESIQEWARILTETVVIRTSEASKVLGNIERVLQLLIRCKWVNASAIYFIVSGMASSSTEHGVPDDYVQNALLGQYREAAIRIGHEAAYAEVVDMCRMLSPDIRSRINERIILSES